MPIIEGTLPQPRIPQLFYFFDTPTREKDSSGGDTSGLLIPGFDHTSRDVAFTSFVYEDVWAGLDSVEFTFEDPNQVLADHPLVQVLRTKVAFSFGYMAGFGSGEDTMQRTMSKARVMTLYRVAQNYPLNGKIQTKLRFFSAGVKMTHLRRNWVYAQSDPAKQRTTQMPATDVAKQIATANGLTYNIEPARDLTNSKRAEWKQTNQTDMEFLNSIAVGLRAKDGREGKYQVMIRGNTLHFGPISVDEASLATFYYRGPNSPIIDFRPKHPADVSKGLGWATMLTGYDSVTGGLGDDSRIGGISNIRNDTGQDKMGSRQTAGDQGEGGVTLDNAGQAPNIPATNDPEQERRRTVQEANADVLARLIERSVHDKLVDLGLPPDEVERDLADDRAELVEEIRQLQSLGTDPNNTIEQVTSPAEGMNDQQGLDYLRMAQLNALTADLDMYGWPLIEAGRCISIGNVSNLFRGRWWIKKAIHRIDRGKGYVTSCDMQKNALGVGDPTPGTQKEKRSPDRLTELVRVCNLDKPAGEVTCEIQVRLTGRVNEIFKATDPAAISAAAQVAEQDAALAAYTARFHRSIRDQLYVPSDATTVNADDFVAERIDIVKLLTGGGRN